MASFEVFGGYAKPSSGLRHLKSIYNAHVVELSLGKGLQVRFRWGGPGDALLSA